MPNTAGYEMNNFIDIFRVNFSEEKKKKLQDVISLVLVRVPSYFKRQVKEQNLF